MPKKPVLGIFSFTCCQGCQFTILFLKELIEILDKFDIQYFHLLKEKNREAKFDLAFVEGAITSKREVRKLKEIRKRSKFLVAIGACACEGGIPSMRNFIENKELQKYVYNQKMLKDSIDAQPIHNFIKVDYFMRGCPIIKREFINFVNNYLEGKITKEFEGPVCDECPRRGKNCFLREKTVCLGSITHGGCKAICLQDNIPCILCRGPLPKANIAGEIKLFRSWGLEEKNILNKLRQFSNLKI